MIDCLCYAANSYNSSLNKEIRKINRPISLKKGLVMTENVCLNGMNSEMTMTNII